MNEIGNVKEGPKAGRAKTATNDKNALNGLLDTTENSENCMQQLIALNLKKINSDNNEKENVSPIQNPFGTRAKRR